MEAVFYVHGMGGSAGEAEHHKPLFGGRDVIGVEYSGGTPREAAGEILDAVKKEREKYDGAALIANSIGAYFSLYASLDRLVDRAYFISPVTDMESVIKGMMERAGVTEERLKAEKLIPVDGGPALSWEYLSQVRAKPVVWNVPTRILCGENDGLIPLDQVKRFAESCGARITVMEGGEHWFHTPVQMSFLDEWIINCFKEKSNG